MENINFNTNWLALTYKCNNKCVWCYAESDSPSAKFLPEKYEQEVANLLSSLKIKRVILIGGEPTLHPNIARITNEITRNNINCGIVSNGRYFSDKEFTHELKKSGLSSIAFSIEGYNSESHDSITRAKGSFNQLSQGLENALSEGFYISTNTVIDSSNVGNLEKIVDLIGDKVKIMTFNIRGICVSKEKEDYPVLPLKESISAFQRIFEYANSKNVKTKLVTPIPLCLLKGNNSTYFKKEKIVSGGPCQLAHGRNFVIDCKGDVLPCTHFVDYPLFNIFEEEQVISMDKFKEKYLSSEGIPSKFRTKMRRYPSKKCSDTACNESCSGGCPLLWMKFNPKEEIKGGVN